MTKLMCVYVGYDLVV